MLSAIKHLTFCILYSILNADFIKTHSSAAGFFPLSVWLLSTAVLGKKLKAASCLVYCILGLAVSWLDMLAGVLTGYLESSTPAQTLILDLAMLAAYALTAGIFLARLYHLPFIQALTAAMLGNFAAYTSGAAADAVAWTYTPLFDGRYLLVLTTIYLPYTLMLLIVLLFSLLLRRSEFHRYFTALFETKKKNCSDPDCKFHSHVHLGNS